MIRRYFALEDHKTGVWTEVRAGVTTFLTMSYILFVNPQILSKAIDVPNAVEVLLVVTALASAVGTMIMGLYARLPFALAPGMGLNAYFAYTVVLGQGIPWPVALGAVFISGCVFLVISVSGIRAAIVAVIPSHLKCAIAAGIGIFLALIGLQHGGFVVDHPATLISVGDMSAPGPLLALAGLALTALLLMYRVPGAVIVGIAAVSLVAILSNAPVFNGTAFSGFSKPFFSLPANSDATWMALDITAALSLGIGAIVFVFLFVDFFDTAGTLIGLSHKIPQHISPLAMNRAFTADALATMFGSLLGTSTTTSYIESAAGVEEGGRSGLTAVVTALCFLLAVGAWPLAAAVPTVATAPALIIVGWLMSSVMNKIDWHDIRTGLPAFVTMLGIPLTFSIAQGISFGILAECGLCLFGGRPKAAHPLLYAIAVVLLLRVFFLASG
ncbi:MAG: NCS2 family permease [Acidobacteria bacterium]|nr:NCS2 family permease [Acidobacteriota bacterium]